MGQLLHLTSRTAVDETLPSMQVVARIQSTVAKAYGLDPRLFRQPIRRRSVSWPRQVAMYLTRERTGKSLQCIGRLFGGLDHSSVHYAIKAVEQRMVSIPFYQEDVEALRQRCEAKAHG